MRRHTIDGALAVACLAILIPRWCGGQSIRGRVVDLATKVPLPGSEVSLTDSRGGVIARLASQEDGRFRADAPSAGTYRIRVAMPGYRLFQTAPISLDVGSDREILIELNSLPPTLLDTILVRGEAVPGYLADFYRRRQSGFGTFLTVEEIERYWPSQTSNLIYHLNGFSISVDNAGNKFVSNMRYGRPCPPLVFVDGIFRGNTVDFDLDQLPAEWIVAVEAYRSPAQTPAEFNMTGASCGVLVLWTRR